jgi:hypothetical protein
MARFMDLAVGLKFTASLNGGPVSEYVKIQEERISCCTVLNAQSTAASSPKVQFLPLAEVEPVQQENNE